MSRAVERIGHERAIARPRIRRRVLGIDPRPREPVAFLAVRPCADTERGVALAANKEVAIGFVGDHAAMTWLVEHRVADVGAFDEPVVVKEDATDGKPGGRGHADVADEPVARQVDVVLELDRDAETRMAQRDVAHQRVLRIAELALPRGVVEPRELPVDEEPRPADIAHRVVGIPHARVVDVAYRVRGIEAHECISVAEDEASRQVFRAESYAAKIQPAPPQQRSKRLGIEPRSISTTSPRDHLAQTPPHPGGTPAVWRPRASGPGVDDSRRA